MEVHAHSHTARKKWTHYFWEFLMLFLAVFAGFLAENQREHYVEHLREKQFIGSLVRDIETDTARINELIKGRDLRQERLESLLYLLNSDSAIYHAREIYYLAVTIPRINLFQLTPSDGTLQQLKNSGGLRLIRSRITLDSLLKYDATVRSLVRLDEQEQSIVNIHREMAPKIFNGIELSKFSDAENLPIRIDSNPSLEPNYKNSLNEFNYRIVSVINVNKGYKREARKIFKHAANLLEVLKSEYNLK